MKLALLAVALAACSPSNPCAAARMRGMSRISARYAGRWAVIRGDTLTLPQMGDRFRLRELALDTGRVVAGTTCRFRGALVFAAPRPDTLAVTWVGEPEQALIYGWPADLGPFGGIGASIARDTLRGALLFDSRLGIEVKPGVTAQFVAGRVRTQ